MLMHRFSTFLIVVCLAFLTAGCQSGDSDENNSNQDGDTQVTKNNGNNENPKMPTQTNPAAGDMKVIERDYGKTADGKEVKEFVCTNKNGIELTMITYGATVTSLKTPDKDGNMANITHSCENLAGYEAHQSYFGCTVGRYCNRIANGKFSIDGKDYTLATNNDPHHLHGGDVGFNRKVWSATKIETPDEVGVKFSLVSEDGDEGYPGNLKVTVDYYLTNDDELVIEYSATTDAPTHVNLTNHNYWNLSGDHSQKILDHELKVESDQFVEADATLIPTGKLLDVKGTPFDFVDFHKIGERIDQLTTEPQGYDHCFVLRGTENMHPAATVRDPSSGRVMEITTTEPGIQFYSGNFLDETAGSGGFAQYTAFCLETQKYPDTPNQPEFPTSLLRPGQTYMHKTVHKFSVMK